MKISVLSSGLAVSFLLVGCATSDYVPASQDTGQIPLYKASIEAQEYAPTRITFQCVLCADKSESIDFFAVSYFESANHDKYLGLAVETKDKTDNPRMCYYALDPRYGGENWLQHEGLSFYSGAIKWNLSGMRGFGCKDPDLITGIYWDSSNRSIAIAFIKSMDALLRAGPDAYAQAIADNDKLFEAQLLKYRAQTINPSLSPNAHDYAIQASDAITNNHMNRAFGLYREALYIDPTWAAGYFNLALMYGDKGQYNTAIKMMKRYLELEPNAPDASKAKDQIAIWLGRESQTD